MAVKSKVKQPAAKKKSSAPAKKTSAGKATKYVYTWGAGRAEVDDAEHLRTKIMPRRKAA